MKKSFANFIVLSGIVLLFFSGTATHEKKYNELKWDAAEIYDFLHLKNVSKAVFNFDKPFLQHYKLSVTAFDSDSNYLKAYSVEVIQGHALSFKNNYPDGLFLESEYDIATYSVNGTKSLYFVPVPFPSAASPLYVAYEVYNEEPYEAAIITKVAVGKIKPVPPYN